ncbi:unnamed protein product, partial [Lepidochelys olivacea]
KAQGAQQTYYNCQATTRKFQVGDRLLVLIPTAESKLLARWQGPYEIIEAIGEVDYKVRQPGHRKLEQIYRINLLKPWQNREVHVVALGAPSPKSDQPDQVGISPELTPEQRSEVISLIKRNQDVFSEKPGRTTEVHHHICPGPGVKVNVKPYWIPEAKREEIRTEVRKMPALGVTEDSHSQWSSPVVLVPKPDGSVRFCNNFRKLNEVSQFDAYPIPRIDELIDRLEKACFMSTLDLTKGYWQIPLAKADKEKMAFATPEGLYQYTVLPFGLHGAPTTFQRLMDKLLRPHGKYAAAYLDDVIIYSPDWETHLEKVEAVLDTLRKAGLTANPSKCSLGLAEAKYLGYIVGRGVGRPQLNKLEAIQKWPRSLQKKTDQGISGTSGVLYTIIPHFATRACPLMDLMKARGPDIVRWTTAAEDAFTDLQTALCTDPILVAPDWGKEFILQTDASDGGLGAVLSQMVGDDEHPVLFLSRKLLPRERNYAVVEKECLVVKW